MLSQRWWWWKLLLLNSDESNKTWVKTNLRTPYKLVMDKAENLLDTLGAVVDPEQEAKVQVVEARRDAKCELVSFEATIKAMVEGLAAAVGLVDNYTALTANVNKVHDDMTRQHLIMGRNYMKLLEGQNVNELN